MHILFSLLAGVLFGLGLIVSGMSDPAKVLGFLDLAGPWDPSLALVMAGAVAVGSITFAAVRNWKVSLLGLPMQLPVARRIDRRLLVGSLLFGAGWGVAGFCPGPALVALGMLEPQALTFVVSMLGGMVLFEVLEAGRRKGAVGAG